MMIDFVKEKYGYTPSNIYEYNNRYLIVFDEIGVMPIVVDKSGNKIQVLDVFELQNRSLIKTFIEKGKKI